ncbi:MAG: transporter substrate-binding domain-containing protein [Myxococcota bacterium]|nr:transporter substrate-binding domain-containing protein [Myxococcota bacterium]
MKASSSTFSKAAFLGALSLCLMISNGVWQNAYAELDDKTGKAPKGQLLIATKQSPPFAIKQPDGTWTGISIELWEDIAKDLNVQYRFQEFDLKWMLSQVSAGKVDAALSAITMTPAREAVLDFSYPYFYSGLGVAVSSTSDSSTLRKLVHAVFSYRSAQYIFAVALALILLLTIILTLNITVESRGVFRTNKNPTSVKSLNHSINGFYSALKWLAGNTTGRLILFVWLSVTLLLVSFYQPVIANSTAIISKSSDLTKISVGTVKNSSSIKYLQQIGVKNLRLFESAEAGLTGVSKGEVTAFVYDRPILKYLSQSSNELEVTVLALQFDPQGYAIALPAGSPLREDINRIMLNRLSNEAYLNGIIGKYIGDKE